MEASAISNAERPLDEQALLTDLKLHAFGPSFGPPRVGIEIEMLVVRDNQAVTLPEFVEAITPLIELGELSDTTHDGSPPTFSYGAITLTFEPGGQIEIVSTPQTSVAAALEDVSKLEMLLDRVLMWNDMRRVHLGINPWQEAFEIPLQTPLPRYTAMQEYFAGIGSDGARMMRLCCAIQINLDAGTPVQARRRWHLANLMSPFLVGIFANSPIAAGKRSGWKSARSRVWHGVDSSRTGILPGGDGPNEYLAFALGAGVLLQRREDGVRPGRPGFTFRDWLHDKSDPAPTLEDWHYHLTTLFPQVRARGYLELRAIDSLPVRWRSVPVALASALLLDDAACLSATRLLEPHCEELTEINLRAARSGLDDPMVARPARALMSLAREAFPRLPDGWISRNIASATAAFDGLYTVRGRCPADDILESQEGQQ